MLTQRLLKKIQWTGIVILESGLHIGGTNAAMSIGGVDKTVVRNPVNGKPYIPGSSLKGKMRALMELADGNLGNKEMGVVRHGPSMDPESRSARLFGTALDAGDDRQRPSRLLVRDAPLLSNESDFPYADMPYTETKTEIVLDRLTARAMPRQNERVPAGARFALDLVLNLFEGDDATEAELVRNVFECLRLVQDDSLGGHGSRGYGKVRFYVSRLLGRSAGYYRGEAGQEDLSAWIPEDFSTGS